uniref:Uncharacterized protein n=1 Tax=Plectus sambesii TaxID=2011161 RepID=A0A914WPJ5_9BILA
MRSVVLLLFIGMSVAQAQLLMYFLNSLGDVLKDAKLPKELQGNFTSPPLINNHLPTDHPHPRIQQLNSRTTTSPAPSTVGMNSVPEEDTLERMSTEATKMNETATASANTQSAMALTKPMVKSGKYRSFLKNVPRLAFSSD